VGWSIERLALKISEEARRAATPACPVLGGSMLACVWCFRSTIVPAAWTDRPRPPGRGARMAYSPRISRDSPVAVV